MAESQPNDGALSALPPEPSPANLQATAQLPASADPSRLGRPVQPRGDARRPQGSHEPTLRFIAEGSGNIFGNENGYEFPREFA